MQSEVNNATPPPPPSEHSHVLGVTYQCVNVLYDERIMVSCFNYCKAALILHSNTAVHPTSTASRLYCSYQSAAYSWGKCPAGLSPCVFGVLPSLIHLKTVLSIQRTCTPTTVPPIYRPSGLILLLPPPPSESVTPARKVLKKWEGGGRSGKVREKQASKPHSKQSAKAKFFPVEMAGIFFCWEQPLMQCL